MYYLLSCRIIKINSINCYKITNNKIKFIKINLKLQRIVKLLHYFRNSLFDRKSLEVGLMFPNNGLILI